MGVAEVRSGRGERGAGAGVGEVPRAPGAGRQGGGRQGGGRRAPSLLFHLWDLPGDVLAAPESASGLDRCNLSLSLSLSLLGGAMRPGVQRVGPVWLDRCSSPLPLCLWVCALVISLHYVCVCVCVCARVHACFHILFFMSLVDLEFTPLEPMLAYLSLLVSCLNRCLRVLARLRREASLP